MPNSKPNIPRVRSWVAIDAHMRRAGEIGNKRGKGRARGDQRSRGQIKRDIQTDH